MSDHTTPEDQFAREGMALSIYRHASNRSWDRDAEKASSGYTIGVLNTSITLMLLHSLITTTFNF